MSRGRGYDRSEFGWAFSHVNYRWWNDISSRPSCQAARDGACKRRKECPITAPSMLDAGTVPSVGAVTVVHTSHNRFFIYACRLQTCE